MVFHPHFNYYRNLQNAASTDQKSRFYYQNYEGAYKTSTRTGFNFPLTQTEDPIYTRTPTSSSKCENNVFKQLRSRTRLKDTWIQRSLTVSSLRECQQACLEDSVCRSFNFMPLFAASLPTNCQLSNFDQQSLDLNNQNYFENSEDFDFYVRDTLGMFINHVDARICCRYLA